MNKELAKQVNDVRKKNPCKEIIIVMHVVEWVKTFKCITSFNEADIYIRTDRCKKEITFIPKELYFSERFKN